MNIRYVYLRRFITQRLLENNIKCKHLSKKKLFELYKNTFNSDHEKDYTNRKDFGIKVDKSFKAKKNSLKKYRKKYKDYLASDQWAKIKIELLEYRGAFCERCGNDNFLQVHHKTYKNVFNEEPEDLEILCKSCHEEEHNIIS